MDYRHRNTSIEQLYENQNKKKPSCFLVEAVEVKLKVGNQNFEIFFLFFSKIFILPHSRVFILFNKKLRFEQQQ